MKAPAVDASLGKDADRIATLRAQITRLTGRITISRDLAYLEQRLASLKKRKAEGGRMPNTKSADPSAVVSASLTKKRRELLARICKEHKVGVSAIIRDAFDSWCKSNGYKLEIEHIQRLEQSEE